MDRRHHQQFPVEQPPPIEGAPHAYAAGHNPQGGEYSFNDNRDQRFGQGQGQNPGFPNPSGAPPAMPSHPPAYGVRQGPPPSGYRVPLGSGQPFPQQAAGAPPFRDADGSPVFIGSAIFEKPDSVHPCKIAPHLNPPARVPYGGGEHEHNGRFDLLPFVPEQMEWVKTSGGRLPQGRRLVEGGYEENGGQLYHACASIHGIDVPGKTAEHLGGANIAFGGQEHTFTENYWILAWR